MLKRTLHICWWTLAAVVVVLALALSAARLLLPGMSEYRGEIEAVAGRIFDRPLSIGSLNAVWRGLSPVLSFEQVVISDPQLPGGKLAIDKVEVSVDVIDSLLQRRLLTRGVSVIGTALDLQTDVRHRIKSLPVDVIVHWLLSQDSVSLDKVSLHWRDPGLFEAPLRIADLSAKLVNQGNRHQFRVEAGLPAAQGDAVKIAGDLSGPAEDFAAWNGTFYLNTRAARLSTFGPALAGSGLVGRGAVDVELWLGLSGARAVWGSGSLDWRQLQVRTSSADAQGIAADSLGARFHWRRSGERWRIGVSDFELRRDGTAVWPASQLQLSVADADGLRIRGRASLLVLDELTGVLPLLPWVDDDALAMLDRLQPRGAMRDAEFSMRYRAGMPPQFAIRSAIDNLTLAANGGQPGVSGISGRIEGNLQAGRLQLDTSSGELILPRVFPQPLPLASLGGELGWQRFKDGFRISSRRLRLKSGPLQAQARLQMDWAYDQARPWLDLQLKADPLPLTAVRNYLPSIVMHPHAVEWLQQAFVAGRADNIRLLLQGRLDQLPFDQGQGRLEARFDFAGVTLDYRDGWRPIEQLDGQAHFSGAAMQVSGDRARINDAPVQRVVAKCEDLRHPMLTVDGTIDGTLASMVDFVRHSPLQDEFGRLIDATETSGDATMQLHLDIPLVHSLGRRVEVQGNILLDGNDLVPRNGDFGLNDIRGRLYFSRSDVSLKSARARVLDRPVALSVYKQGKGADAVTVVNVQGRLKLVDRARQRFPDLGTWLQGDTGWQALLQVRDHEKSGTPRVSMRLFSGLQGVAVNLPPPFAKTADETRSVTVDWVPGDETEWPMRIRYGDRVNVGLLLSADHRLRKAAVQFGDAEAPLPADDEVRISGSQAVFDLDQWLPVFRAFGGSGGNSALGFGVELAIDALRLGDLQVPSVRLVSRSSDQWYFQLSGEGAGGWVRWIPGGRVLTSQLLARLNHLRIDSREREHAATAALQPDAMPDLDVEISDLVWNKREFGAVGVVSEHSGTGVHFSSLKLESPALTVSGTGDWQDRNGVQTSRIQATISKGNLERLSKLFGSDSGIRGGTLQGSVQLAWPGSPADFSLARIEGELDLQSKDGRLENVEEGAGKLLSLLSLNSLQRRLSLDFSDVVKEGLSYNVMKGHFVVMDGDAFTNDFTLEGTSVDVAVSGRTGLVAHDYNQLVTVTPQVTSTLPIAGAIAGGPLVGAAAFVADKLLGDSFNRLTQVRYQVTGTWDDPVYTKLKKNNPPRSATSAADQEP